MRDPLPPTLLCSEVPRPGSVPSRKWECRRVCRSHGTKRARGPLSLFDYSERLSLPWTARPLAQRVSVTLAWSPVPPLTSPLWGLGLGPPLPHPKSTETPGADFQRI